MIRARHFFNCLLVTGLLVEGARPTDDNAVAAEMKPGGAMVKEIHTHDAQGKANALLQEKPAGSAKPAAGLKHEGLGGKSKEQVASKKDEVQSLKQASGELNKLEEKSKASSEEKSKAEPQRKSGPPGGGISGDDESSAEASEGVSNEEPITDQSIAVKDLFKNTKSKITELRTAKNGVATIMSKVANAISGVNSATNGYEESINELAANFARLHEEAQNVHSDLLTELKDRESKRMCALQNVDRLLKGQPPKPCDGYKPPSMMYKHDADEDDGGSDAGGATPASSGGGGDGGSGDAGSGGESS